MNPESSPIEFKTGVYRLPHLGGHYLEIPAAIVIRLGGSFSIRLWCTVNGRVRFQCGLVALGEGTGYISLNSTRMKEIGAKEGDDVSVSLCEDHSEYGVELPAELEELFRQDAEGKKRFDGLVPGKQRFIIRYVSGVKNAQLRVEKAVFVIENLKKLPLGKESFKGMMGQAG